MMFPAHEPTQRAFRAPFHQIPSVWGRTGCLTASVLTCPSLGVREQAPHQRKCCEEFWPPLGRCRRLEGGKAAAVPPPESVSHSEPGSLPCQKAPSQQDLARCGCFSFTAIPWPPELDTQLRWFSGSLSCEMRFIYRKAYKMQLRQLWQATTKDLSLFLTHARGFWIHPEESAAINIYARKNYGSRNLLNFLKKLTGTLHAGRMLTYVTMGLQFI